MSRVAAGILLLTVAAAAQSPSVVLVDGRRVAIDDVLAGGQETIRLRLRDTPHWAVPTRNIVAIDFAEEAAPDAAKLFNLYLRNDDRLHGTVTGAGAGFLLQSNSVKGLKIPLEEVRAIRFGRLLHGLQAKYDDVFADELAKGREVVIVQRDTRPFPIAARVLGVNAQNLTVLVGETKRDLPLHKVYGFVRVPAAAPTDAGNGIRTRVHIAQGARVTLPLQSIDGSSIGAGGATILRAAVQRIEFGGAHIGHVADFDPIDVKELGLFGDARKWRRNEMVLGGPLRLGGQRHDRGIGVHAYSRMEFALGKRWKTLYVRCGIDDAAGAEGAATFRILGDGKVLKEVACTRTGQQSVAVRLDVSDVDRLVLEADPGESHTSDFCDWAEARVFNAPPVEVPPVEASSEEKK